MTRICWKTKRKQVLLAGTMVPPACTSVQVIFIASSACSSKACKASFVKVVTGQATIVKLGSA